MQTYIIIVLVLFGVINLIWAKAYIKSNEEWYDLGCEINSDWAEHCRELIDEIIKVKKEVNELKKTVDEMQEKVNFEGRE